MSFQEDIDSFKLWATKLGCPPESLPTEEALKSIFKSRQRDFFIDMMKRVLPRQEVQEFRANILVKSAEKQHDEGIVPACTRSLLPKQMKTYLQLKELRVHQSEVERQFKELSTEYEDLASTIKSKNIQTMSLQHKQKTLQAKVNLFRHKAGALDKNIEEEKQLKAKIIANMPVKLSAKNANDSAAMEAVKQALSELEEIKDGLWKKMRTIFANIPNFLIFNAIMRLKEEQLQHIITLNKSSLQDSSLHGTRSLSVSSVLSKQSSLSAFELKLLTTQADLLGIIAKYLAARAENSQLEERFSSVYTPFIDELHKKMLLFNGGVTGEGEISDVISDYVVQYCLRNYNRSRNDFLEHQIERLKVEIEADAKKLENHEVLLGSIKQVYSEINTSINRIQYEMVQLGRIKEKILYAQNKMKHAMDADLNAPHANAAAGAAKSNFLLPSSAKNINNASIMGADSFEVSSEGVFCSTQLDFDATINSLNNTTMRPSCSTSMVDASAALTAVGNNTIPPHLMELNTCAEIPLEKFSCVPQECAFYLGPNPLIVESRELSSTVQLVPGHLLTAFGALQEVRSRCAWADLIAAHSNDLKLDLDSIMVDSNAFKQKAKQQHERIAELLDKIDVTAIQTKLALKKASKLYNFILENPLRHYIPPTKCFNNQSYADYEAEYNLYYRMATIGTCTKK